MTYSDPQFWIALLQIIGIDILLAGDNAVVIALAARNLPQKQRTVAIVGGTAGAIGLRIAFATVIVYLMTVPYLKLVGAVLLFWVAIKLLVPEEGGVDEEGKIKAGTTIWSAMWTIVVADAVMSLDNVIGIAAAAKDNVTLIVLGLLISIPLVVLGSTMLLKLLDRYPILITLGGGLLGWIAGGIAVVDPAIAQYTQPHQPMIHYVAAVAGTVFVVALGKFLVRRRDHRRKIESVASEHHGASGS
ncbi:MAG: TerC family protein [Alphaproteobacteria bacterium]|nr:TerC family protein [Alphaproteobacteria bacterium]MBM3733683.1 TerC family protein [Acidimicrobiia bacterium]MBM3950528.1 TerC family protein [Rhodospirillales bacterium]